MIPTQSWIHPNIEIKASEIGGKGMFATSPICLGEKVLVWGGKYVHKEEAERAVQEEKLILQWDNDLYSVEDRGEDDTYFINHSCDPNVWMDDAFTLIARRNISIGEELLADYALWEAREDYISSWDCHCGAKNCRGKVRGTDWALPELQISYAGHFSPLLNKRIIDEKTDSKGFQLQTTLFEGFRIEQLRSPRAAPHAEFLPAQVVFDGQEMWSFGKEYKNYGFAGMAFLREVGDELVIMISTKQSLCEVVPVRDLSHRQRIGGESIGGRKLKDLVALKELIAQAEGLEPIWSQREATLRTAINKTLTAARQAAKMEEEAVAEKERAKRRAERDAKRAEIAGRKRIFAHTLSGDRRHGYPVVGDEWLMLGHGAFCISVTSYNTKTGEVGELIESFMVKKDGARKVRQAVTAVTREPSLSHTNTAKMAPQSISFLTVPVKGEMEEVIVVANMDGIRALRDHGLNSGTLAMCPKAGDEDRYSVFSLTAGKIEPVTELMRKK